MSSSMLLDIPLDVADSLRKLAEVNGTDPATMVAGLVAAELVRREVRERRDEARAALKPVR